MRSITHFGLAAAVTLSAAGYAQTPSSTPPATTPSSTQAAPAPTTPAAPASTTSDDTKAAPAQANAQVSSDTPADKSTSTDTTPAPKTKKQIKEASKQQANAQTKTDDLPSPGEALDPHIKPGSEDDVNAVGTRNIGGRGAGNWYSTDWEIRAGKGYSMEVEKSAHMVTDPVIVEYVNRVGQNIVKNSDCKVPFTIKVIDSDEVNAMALPGGFFYVNSGLILAADEEAELAGVMAHETAHVCAHHAAREQTRANYAQIGAMAAMIAIPGWAGYGIYEASGLLIPLTFLQFSREFEAQADYLGVQYMYRAGYDPQAFVTFFEKVQNLEKRKPGMVAKAFSSHPQTPDRIAHSQEEIAHILPPRDEYVVTTSEFDDVKARLARIENKRRLTDKSNGAKPTLRRASTTVGDPSAGGNNNPNSSSTTTSSTTSDGDDQPTLHRRDN